MTERRWKPGMKVSTGDGLEWRVAKGAKSPGDLVLEVHTPTGWQRVKMSAGFLMADFLAENEDQLVADGYFPKSAAGGAYYLKYVRMAVSEGWSVASNRVETDREARRAREQGRVAAPPALLVPCFTCGTLPVGTYSDGSPRYGCGPHAPAVPHAHDWQEEGFGTYRCAACGERYEPAA